MRLKLRLKLLVQVNPPKADRMMMKILFAKDPQSHNSDAEDTFTFDISTN